MYLVDDVDNKELLREIIIDTCKGLPKQESLQTYKKVIKYTSIPQEYTSVFL